MNSPESTKPRVWIQLLVGEYIVERGTHQVSWNVRLDGRWRDARQHPTTRIQKLEAGPGTVWETQLSLELEVGTEVQRVDIEPDRVEPRDPLSFLFAEKKGAPRRSRRQLFTVSARGKLLRTGSKPGTFGE